jgi:hypothetical protein
MRSHVVTFETIYGRARNVRLFGSDASIIKSAHRLRTILADLWGCSPLAVGVSVAR